MSRRRTADDGFTLLETIVALGIVGTVMASLAVFFVGSETALRRQADTQVAIQLTAGAMDYVSQLPGDNVLLGRTQQAVQAQWQAPGVEAYLGPARAEPAWQDPTLPTPSSVQGLPTAPQAVTVNNEATPYQRWWYVGRCWQTRIGGDCAVVPATQRDESVEMFRIVVVITWPSPGCPGNRCQYLATMLTERGLVDPVWE